MTYKTIFGTPGALFLQAKRHECRFVSGPHKISVDKEGDLLDGSLYKIFSSSAEGTVLSFNTLNRALFSKSVYPALEDGQVFVISDMIIREKDIEFIGNVLELI